MDSVEKEKKVEKKTPSRFNLLCWYRFGCGLCLTSMSCFILVATISVFILATVEDVSLHPLVDEHQAREFHRIQTGVIISTKELQTTMTKVTDLLISLVLITFEVCAYLVSHIQKIFNA